MRDFCRWREGLCWRTVCPAIFRLDHTAFGQHDRDDPLAVAATRVRALGDEVVFAPGVGGARDVPDFAQPSLHVPLESAYYLVCPEVIADRIAVAAFRKWLLEQAKKP